MRTIPIRYDLAALRPFPARIPPVKSTTVYRVALGEDRQPDAWQIALATDAWPRVLIAPTGSGKTAAVTLGWVARRLRNPDTTPRRLVWCLPMRTLVEQTATAVRDWFGRLAAGTDSNDPLPRPEDVHVLMGGAEAEGWLGRAGASGGARRHPGHAAEPGADAGPCVVPGALADGVRPSARGRAVGVRRGAAHGRAPRYLELVRASVCSSSIMELGWLRPPGPIVPTGTERPLR